jgi:hypothetical protein
MLKKAKRDWQKIAREASLLAKFSEALDEPFGPGCRHIRCVLGKPRKNEQKPGLKDDEDRYLQGHDGGGNLLLSAERPSATIGAGD